MFLCSGPLEPNPHKQHQEILADYQVKDLYSSAKFRRGTQRFRRGWRRRTHSQPQEDSPADYHFQILCSVQRSDHRKELYLEERRGIWWSENKLPFQRSVPKQDTLHVPFQRFVRSRYQDYYQKLKRAEPKSPRVRSCLRDLGQGSDL